ncbi:uncharacterized protein LOC118439388 isoform X2 [Folsomia candida]|uniref:uncharacterized protein LOC118439388 isoform X2 n=1 Tax=Folsomia candida TaxID=158441 RepID=UPI001604DACB|nr:uncharacterized protein LOC118439388 isoform X2 [Folsomia candida]
MEPAFIHQINQLGQQLDLLKEYIELKFGLDFSQFRTLKASSPNADIIFLHTDGSLQYRDELVERNEEQDDDIKDEGEQVDDDDDHVEIGDEGVSVHWGEDGKPSFEEREDFNDQREQGDQDEIDDWGQDSLPVVTSVYELEPDDVNVPAFDDDNYSNHQGEGDDEDNIPASFYQSYSGSYQYDNGNNDERAEDDSSAVYGQEEEIGHDVESVALVTNSPHNDHNYYKEHSTALYGQEERIANDDNYGAESVNNSSPPQADTFLIPLTINRRKRKANPSPEGKSGGVMKNIGNLIVPPFKDNFMDEDNSGKLIKHPERKRAKVTDRKSPRATETLTFRARNGNDDNDDEEEQDGDDDHEEKLSLQIANESTSTDDGLFVEKITRPDKPPEGKRFKNQIARKSVPATEDQLGQGTKEKRAATVAARKAEKGRGARQEDMLPRKSQFGRKWSKVYTYYDLDETLQKYVCKRCGNSYFMGGTGPLIRHLRTHEDLREELKTAIFRPQAR